LFDGTDANNSIKYNNNCCGADKKVEYCDKISERATEALRL